MRFKLLKSNKINEDINDANMYINKQSYYNIIILLKTIVALIYAFYLGYNLFYFGDDFINYGIKFIVILFIIYLFFDIPYNLSKLIFLPEVFKKDNIIIYINPFNLSIDVCFKKEVNKYYLIFINLITIIIFSFIPNILLFIKEFNIYIYALAAASSIFIIKDLIYTILLILFNKKRIISNPHFFKGIE